LSEGDDLQDPVADASRAILDGHIVLSRKLADEGHYPAIDIEASISRAMPQIVDEAWIRKAQMLKQLYAHYQENKDLVAVGAYQAGADPTLDLALNRLPHIQKFLQQGLNESSSIEESKALLDGVLPDVPQNNGAGNG